MSNIYNVWWHQVPLSDYDKKILLTQIGDEQTLYEATPKMYHGWGLTDLAINRLEESKRHLPACEKILVSCEQKAITLIGYRDEAYPTLLREIQDPPMLLYTKGNTRLLTKTCIGIVGARKCTEYGYRMAHQLGKSLAEAGLCVVSGMAMGIDEAAQRGALKAGDTISVVGTGVDLCYPACNQTLYEQLIVAGCVISEYEPGTEARPYHFPRRNRLISGMSYGVAVVEAAQKSGSLITAQLALGYEREVYAIPGNADQRLSQGTNTLLKKGAKCITCSEDILAELPNGLCIKSTDNNKNRNKLHNELAQEERIVYASVSQEPILFGEIIENTQLSYESINTSLLQLEVKGLIQRLPGERYVRI